MRRIAMTAALLAGAPALAGPMQPGLWQITTRITDIKMAGAPPGMAAAMRGRPIAVSRCVTPAEAAQGPKEAMKSSKQCRYTSYSAIGGRIAATTVCDMGQTRVTGSSSGSFTPTSFTANFRSVMSGAQSMTTAGVVTGKRVGACR